MPEPTLERSQADSASLYSGAQSFLSFLDAGVDPRTGVYSIRVSLPDIATNALAGPDMMLSLAFDPLQNVDSGLGRGWSWGTSRLTPASRRLALGNGETHVAIVEDGEIVLPDRKLPTFRVEKSADVVLVTYKSGRQERLVQFNRDDPLSPYVLREVMSVEGRSLFFDWVYFEGQPALAEIRDSEQRKLLTVSRDTRAVSISVAADDGSLALFTLTLTGDLVTAIKLPVPEQAAWELSYSRYTPADIAFLTRVKSPTGSVETIAYEEQGHAFPLRENDPPDKLPERLPYVARHTMNPGGGQPLRVTRYSYSPHNFLGFGAGVDWEDATDGLYKVLSDYRYDSTEQMLDANDMPLVTIYREYDRFHGKRIERRTEGDCVTETIDEYHDEAGKSWYEQPAIVALISRHTVRYTRGGVSRDDVTTFAYDAFGNVTESVGPDGVRERTEYFDPAGEEGCPADPVWHTPRTVKSVTVEPGTIGEDNPALSRTTHYRYSRWSPMASHAHDYLVCVETAMSTHEGQHQVTTFEYEDNPLSLLLHGRLRRKSDTVAGFCTSIEYAYDVFGDILITDEIISTDFDNSVSETTTHRSVFSGLELRRESPDQILTYVHDALGRVVEESTVPKSGDVAYMATVKHIYLFPAGEGGEVSHEVINESGIAVTQYFDGTGRCVRETRMAPDVGNGESHDTSRFEYDALARRVRETQYDLNDGKTLVMERQFRYDGWEQQCAVEYVGGRVEHAEFDPITRVERTWLSSGQSRTGETVRRLNRFDKVESESRYQIDGRLVSLRENEYDGLGRLTGVTEPGLRTTTFAYDYADRVMLTTLPDDTVIAREFVAHSLAEEVSIMRVNDVELGRREFDGLLRLATQTVGSCTTSWTFDGDRTHPREERRSDGETVTYEVNPSLTDQMMRRASDDEDIRYEYDEKSGLLVFSRRETQGGFVSEYRCERFASGELRQETSTNDGVARTATYVWTLGGRLSRYVDEAGNEHIFDYDATSGQLKREAIGDVSIAFEYDAFERIERHVVTQGGQLCLTMTLGYDDLGREVQRVFASPGHPSLTLEQTYDGLDLIQSRTRKLGETIELSENFSYDKRGRPELSYSIGPGAPHDPHDPAHQIQVHQWEYDAFDNVRLVTAWHASDDGGPKTAHYRYDDAADVTRLTSLELAGYGDKDGVVTFEYDAAGRMTRAERGYEITYNAFDQIRSVTSGGEPLAQYFYNGLDEQCRVDLPGEPSRERAFRETRLAVEMREGAARTYLSNGIGALDDGGALDLYATDWKASVMQVHRSDGERNDVAYTVSGYRGGAELDGVPGLDGELVDPATQWLWLGNSRMYSPVLARFMVPDSLSPFDGGGINGYARFDPVNSIDPTGHFPTWLVMAVGVLAAVGAVAVAVISAGGFAGVAVAAKITSKAVIGKVGVASTTSATSLATVMETTVTAAALSTAKLATGSIGAVLGAGGTVVRASGQDVVATYLATIGGMFTIASFALSYDTLLAAYRRVAERIARGKEALAASRSPNAVQSGGPAANSVGQASRSAAESPASSLRSLGLGRPPTPDRIPVDRGVTSSGTPSNSAFHTPRSSWGGSEYGFAQASSGNAINPTFQSAQWPSGGGALTAQPTPVMDSAERIRLVNRHLERVRGSF